MSDTSMHYLDATLATAAENVALDEALLVEAEERGGPPILRIWELGHNAVILGASCRLAENVRSEACRADGVEVARRSSGGGTVVVGPGALNVSVILPIRSHPELRGVETAQRHVLSRFLEAIRASGPTDAEMQGSGDLTLHGRKFSGSAQRRLRDHVLIHASMLYNFPLDLIARYTALPQRRPDYRGERRHDDFVTNLSMSRDSLREICRVAWLPPGPGIETAEIPREGLNRLLETKFSKSGWIERL